jgi:hypothetical protein
LFFLGAVEAFSDYVGVRKDQGHVGGIQSLAVSVDLNLRIYSQHILDCAIDFAAPYLVGEVLLSCQVASLDLVKISNYQPAYPRPRQGHTDGRAEPSEARDADRCTPQLLTD